MIRFATVGTSTITERFLEAAALVPPLKYAAAYSRDGARAAEFARRHGCDSSFDSLARLACSEQIDAVYLASPNAYHAPQSRLFLEHGKHVLCEKPIAVSAEEYCSLRDLARKNGVVYMEAMMSCNTLWHSRVRAAVEGLGTIALARLDFCQRSSRYDAFVSGTPQNIFDMSLHAGTLMDLGVYCVYAAVDLLGAPRRVLAASALFENGADRAGGAILDYGGFQALLSYSKAGQSALGSEIVGDNGTLKIASVSQYTGVTLVQDGCPELIVPEMPRAEVMRGEAERFAALVGAPEKNAACAAELSRLCETVHRCMDEIKRAAGLRYPAPANR